MEVCLVDPVKGFEYCADDREEKAGKEPAHDLGIDVVFTRLPVGINSQSAKNTTNGTNDQHQVGYTEIPTMHLTASLIKFRYTWLGQATSW